MTDKEFKKLKRGDLVSIIYEYQKIHESLIKENEELKQKLESKETKISKAGSIAEIAAELNNIFGVAQKTADDYVERVRLSVQDTDHKADEIIAEAEKKAAEITAEAEKKAEEIIAEAEKKAAEITTEAESKADEINAEAIDNTEEAVAEAENDVSSGSDDSDNDGSEIKDKDNESE